MTATLEEPEVAAEDVPDMSRAGINLATKYRPMNFRDVQGQPEVQGLAAMIDKNGQGSVSQAYLFEGTRGSGKTTTARILARAVNCLDLQPGGEPCNVCDSCARIIEFGWEEAVVEADAASNRGVNDMKEIVDRTVLATRAKKRVVIIDEAHSLTKQAQESLLKVLEEPSDQVIWIFCTTDPNDIKPTIISRCTRVSMRDLSIDTLERVLENINDKEELDLPPEMISKAAYRGHGSARDAITSLQRLMLHDGDNTIQSYKMLDDAIASKSESEFLRASENVFQIDASFDSGSYTQHLIESLRAAMILQIDESHVDPRHEYLDQINAMADSFGKPKLIRALRHFSSELPQINRVGVNSRVIMEAAVISFLVPSASGNANLIFDAIDEMRDELQAFMDEMREKFSNGIPVAQAKKESDDPWSDDSPESDPLLDDLGSAKEEEATSADDEEEVEEEKPKKSKKSDKKKSKKKSDPEPEPEPEPEEDDEPEDSSEDEENQDSDGDEPEEENDEGDEEENDEPRGTKASDDDIIDGYDEALESKKLGNRARRALEVEDEDIKIKRDGKFATKIIVSTEYPVSKIASDFMSDYFRENFDMEFEVIEKED